MICDYIDVIWFWCSIWNWHFSIWHFHFLSLHVACGISYFTLHTSYSTLTFHVSDIVVVSELNSNCLFFFLKPAVPSRATLIISPAPIAQQWVDEIFRHTEPSSIKLLVRNNSMVSPIVLPGKDWLILCYFNTIFQVYEGVTKSGFILPEVLADHDVILTTYSTLRSDFYHLGSKQGQSFCNNQHKCCVNPRNSFLFSEWQYDVFLTLCCLVPPSPGASLSLHLYGNNSHLVKYMSCLLLTQSAKGQRNRTTSIGCGNFEKETLWTCKICWWSTKQNKIDDIRSGISYCERKIFFMLNFYFVSVTLSINTIWIWHFQKTWAWALPKEFFFL